MESKTEENLAFLYRLNLDSNPLHIIPELAEVGGFDKPILHGLCTYGHTVRMVYQNYCDGDETRIQRTGVRFTSHVFPGETLVCEMWKRGDNIIFKTRTKERGKVALKGYVGLKPSAKL